MRRVPSEFAFFDTTKIVRHSTKVVCVTTAMAAARLGLPITKLLMPSADGS